MVCDDGKVADEGSSVSGLGHVDCCGGPVGKDEGLGGELDEDSGSWRVSSIGWFCGC